MENSKHRAHLLSYMRDASFKEFPKKQMKFSRESTKEIYKEISHFPFVLELQKQP
jgi:hypothetical protein